jgi:hypothetical protein
MIYVYINFDHAELIVAVCNPVQFIKFFHYAACTEEHYAITFEILPVHDMQ